MMASPSNIICKISSINIDKGNAGIYLAWVEIALNFGRYSIFELLGGETWVEIERGDGWYSILSSYGGNFPQVKFSNIIFSTHE